MPFFPYLFFFPTIGSMRLIVLNCGSRLNQCVQRQRCGWSLKTPMWRTMEKIRSGSVFVPGPLCSLRKCFAALFLHIILLLLSTDNTSALIHLLLLSWFNTIHPSLSDPQTLLLCLLSSDSTPASIAHNLSYLFSLSLLSFTLFSHHSLLLPSLSHSFSSCPPHYPPHYCGALPCHINTPTFCWSF